MTSYKKLRHSYVIETVSQSGPELPKWEGLRPGVDIGEECKQCRDVIVLSMFIRLSDDISSRISD